jgi:AraC family transcriptional regulator
VKVDLIERQPVRIVYLRHVGPYGRPLAQFWKERVMPWLASRGLKERAMFAISLDNPNVTPPGQCRCDVGVEVDEAFIVEGDEKLQTIPGGSYASTKFFGTVDEIGATWAAMFNEWLPESGMQLDAATRPTFEYYAADMAYDEATRAFGCDVIIPVK